MDNFLPFNKHYTVVTTPLFPPSIFFLCSISVLISTFTYEQQQYSKGRTRQNGKRMIFCTALPPSQLLPNHFNLTVTNLHFFFWWKIYINIKRSEMLRRVCCMEAVDCVECPIQSTCMMQEHFRSIACGSWPGVWSLPVNFCWYCFYKTSQNSVQSGSEPHLPCTSVQKLPVKV